MDEKTISESENFEPIKKDLLRVATSIGGIRQIKIQDPKYLDKLDKYQKSLPKGEDIRITLDTCSNNLRAYIDTAKKTRVSSFQPLINKYLESLNKEQKDCRVIENNLFRVGCLEIETKSENASIKVSFNQNILIPWRPVTTQNDIESALGDAYKKLKETQIDTTIFPDLLLNAYKKIRLIQERDGQRNSDMIPIRSLHGEVILGLFQHELKSRKNYDTRFKEIYYPLWAFQYNLDKYRSSIETIPMEKRLSFEQGTQSDTGKFGIILNGLTANSDYKEFCYLRSSAVK